MLSEARKQEIVKSRFTGAVDICKALQCIDDALKAAPAISESEDAIQAVRVVLEQNAVYFARSTIEEIVAAARKGGCDV
ncbi:hypothetical protein C3Y08_01705 [Burkholderia gladioli]|nr:hypothetical protein C3Y08_01705 [Burkholderia gladioli]